MSRGSMAIALGALWLLVTEVQFRCRENAGDYPLIDLNRPQVIDEVIANVFYLFGAHVTILQGKVHRAFIIVEELDKFPFLLWSGIQNARRGGILFVKKQKHTKTNDSRGDGLCYSSPSAH